MTQMIAAPARFGGQPFETVLYEARLAEVPVHGALTHIEGRAMPYAAWTNRGWYLESVREGALDKSIEEAASALPLLMFHDETSWPIGVSEEWDSRKDGLHGVWRLDESDDAQRAARLARDGMLKWFSVSISPIRSSWEFVGDDSWDPAKGPDFMDRVTRDEARLLETSLVTTPAFSSAQVRLVHTDTKPPKDRDRRPSLNAWRRYLAEVRG